MTAATALTTLDLAAVGTTLLLVFWLAVIWVGVRYSETRAAERYPEVAAESEDMWAGFERARAAHPAPTPSVQLPPDPDNERRTDV